MSKPTTTFNEENFVMRRLVKSSPFLQSMLANRLAMIGLGILILIISMALYALIFIDLTEIMRTQIGVNPTMAPPSQEHPFGTDIHGRDIFNRVLYGALFALQFGVIVVTASTALGVCLGIIAAYVGGFVDNVIMRTMDVFLSFPSILLAMAFVAILGTGMWNVAIALTIVYTPRFARVIRGAALKVLQEEYIIASRSMGMSHTRTLFRHVLPNCIAPITVQSTLNLGLVILDFAGLSFLGFGAPPGTPSWGLMLSQGVEHGLLSGHWWYYFFPGFFLALTVLGFNLLGDAMRDALDPKMRETVE